MTIKEIIYDSNEYKELLNFRYTNLREPLGLNWSKEDLLNEDKQIHIALIHNNSIIGSCALKILNNKTLKIRQMAVAKEFQNKGYGKELIQYAESYAKKKKFIEIIITARLSALDFYSKFGYHATGKKFIDVTVESIKMIKILNHN
mgnify:CR=1 FL=1